jgi:hypothetical protein
MILTILAGLLGICILNTIFFAVPYLMPRINMSEVLSYQIFGNFLFFFYLFLPSNHGLFDFDAIMGDTLKGGKKR